MKFKLHLPENRKTKVLDCFASWLIRNMPAGDAGDDQRATLTEQFRRDVFADLELLALQPADTDLATAV